MRSTIGISLLFIAAFLWGPLALAAQTAAAEETDRIEYADASLDSTVPAANAWADIIGGSLELIDEDTLVATIDLTALPEFQPGAAYLVVFSDGLRDWYAGAYAAPSIEFAFGPWNADGMYPDDFIETSGSYATGAPGSVTVELPVARFSDAEVLSAPMGLAGDIKTGAVGIVAPLPLPAVIPLDETPPGEGEIRLPREPEPTTEAEAGLDDDEEAEAVAPAAAAAESSADPTLPSADDKKSATVPVTGALAILGAVVGAVIASGRKGA